MGAGFGCELAGFNSDAEHIHPLVHFRPPSPSPGWSTSSTASHPRLRQQLPDLRQHYGRPKRLQSVSHFAGPADGAPVTVLRYIEQENRPARPAPRPAATAGLKADAPAAILVARAGGRYS